MKYTHLTVRLPSSLLAATFKKVRQGDLSLSQVLLKFLETYTDSEPVKRAE